MAETRETFDRFEHAHSTSVTKTGLRKRDITTTDDDTKKIKRAELIKATADIPYSFTQIEAALRECRGSVADAAEKLGVLRAPLKRKIDHTPYLQQVQQDIRQRFVDDTEQKLMDLVNEGNVTAVTFTLRTLGKERGFSEKNTLELDVPGGIRNAASLIGAMRKGMEGASDDAIIEVDDYEVEEEDEWQNPETL
jgi:hypothetical protein